MTKEFSFIKLEKKNLESQKEYIKQYFVPLKNGDHAVFIDGDFTIMTQGDVSKTYFNRMSSELNNWYFKKFNELRSVVYEVGQDRFYGDKLNLCPSTLHKYKPYDEFNEDIKAHVETMMNYILEILSNNNKEFQTYIISWISNLLKGNKNDSCLYFRGEQGNGKSTLFTFLRKYIIGEKLFLETGSEPIKSKFNKCLGGKLLVLFEELETFSVNEWVAISSKLKRYITSDTIELEAKGKDSYTTNNMNNYVIISNNDAIKDDDGRRYFISDISNKRTGDAKYWDNIYNNCFNLEVGHAFYCRMLEINTDKFRPQADMPLTQSKLDSMAKRLDTVEQFLKSEYVLKQKGICCTVQLLYDEFKAICYEKGLTKPLSKIDFNSKMEKLGIKYFKSDSVNKYKAKAEDLKAIADKRHWIHDIDDIKKDNDGFIDDEEEEIKEDVHDVDFGVDMDSKETKLKKENRQLKDDLEALRAQLAELTKEAPKPKTKNLFLEMDELAESDDLKNENINESIKKIKK